MTEIQSRHVEYLDSLREWRGAQDAKNDEIMRRLDQAEAAIKEIDKRQDTLFVRILAAMGTLLGIGIAISQLL